MAPVELRLDSGIELAGESKLSNAASVWLPAIIPPRPVVLLCLAGGNMNRRYFDLRPDDGDDSFSFASQMAQRGFIVAALDHLGLGDSSKPADGYALTPEVLTQANMNATMEILARLRQGRLMPEVEPMPALRSIGVGHSMGAMMTVLQQARARQHSALVLLGFTTRGLPDYLPPDVKALSQEQQRAGLVEFARQMFKLPYPVIRSSGNGAEIYGSAKAEPRGVAALKAATDCLLPVPAFMSLLPGNVAPEAAQLDVPVFIGVGERDMTGKPKEIPAAFGASPGVSLYILPEAGHSHFLFPTRLQLFDRLAEWAKSV